MSEVPEGVLYGMGNPLLDISAVVPADYLEKYGLKTANACLAEEKHMPMYHELVEKFKVEYIPGGATQNSIRVAQWMLKTPRRAVFVGAIGKDKFGETQKECCEKAGVRTLYQISPDTPTGTCAVLVVDHERSLVANVAAAAKFTADHLATPEVAAAINAAKVFYSASFFLLSCAEASLKVAEHATQHGKTFMINLAAPFICEFFLDKVMSVFVHADIVFGNETEARAFAAANKFAETNDVREIAKLTNQLPSNKKDKRIIIYTQGPEPAIVCFPDGRLAEFPPIPCPASELVDVNGAGDAFVGGFLSQWVQNKPIEECMRAGHWASSIVIRRSGCTFPDTCEFK